MADGSFGLTFDDATSTLVVTGDLDDGSVKAFAGALERGSKESPTLRVDLSEVNYSPSLALGALVVARQQAAEKERTIDVVARRGTIAQQVLRVTGLAHNVE